MKSGVGPSNALNVATPSDCPSFGERRCTTSQQSEFRRPTAEMQKESF
jgi:hypothetical protein